MTQQACTYEQTMRLNYLLHLPPGYDSDPDRQWPLILFLHGMGERGDDLDLVKVHGIPKVVEQQPDFPFVAVSPQCPDGTVWANQIVPLKGLLESVISAHRVDPDRIYLTGLSMGGFGTWALAIMYPHFFAAIAPICGGGRPRWVEQIKTIPTWVFHGDADDTVPLSDSEAMVDALRAVGGDVTFTVYPGVGHDSWTQTYDNPALYEWFLSHTRRKES